ncbi:hypothetical protein [Candidatus Binatus sp.]|uniref:hypothetical protein n=1 Tax=Candidatus Binatus sp. TaxID=2811406 RepID=UPI003CBE1946
MAKIPNGSKIDTASVYAALHFDRVFIAFRSKKDTWTRLSLDFKKKKPRWYKKRISRDEAAQWVDWESKLRRKEREFRDINQIG